MPGKRDKYAWSGSDSAVGYVAKVIKQRLLQLYCGALLMLTIMWRRLGSAEVVSFVMWCVWPGAMCTGALGSEGQAASWKLVHVLDGKFSKKRTLSHVQLLMC